MNTINLQDDQQYVNSARDNVDVINKGLIDIESIQSDVESIHSIHVLRH